MLIVFVLEFKGYKEIKVIQRYKFHLYNIFFIKNINENLSTYITKIEKVLSHF